MFRSSTSKNLTQRLRDGLSADERRAAERHGIDSRFVTAVREAINRLPVAGSQDRRVRYQDENWLVSMHRWITEHREAGHDLRAIRDAVMECVRELDVEITAELASEPVTVDVLVDVVKVETVVGSQQDVAIVEAVHLKTPGALRALADRSLRQVSELLRLAHVARVLSSKAVGR